ncbi:MAG: ATP-binding protein, partial [Bacteroidota bacterium]
LKAFNDNQTQQLTRLEDEYNFRKERDSINLAFMERRKEAELEKSKQKLLYQNEIERRKLIQNTTWLVLGLLLILLVTLGAFYYSKRNSAIEISRQKEQLELAYLNSEKTLKKLKDAQSKLVESEKLASLGEVMASVAHEINNPVNFISSGVMAIRKNLLALISSNKLEEAKEQKANSEIITDMNRLFKNVDEGINRTTEIVRELQVFAHPDNKDYGSVDLISSIDSTLMILKGKLKSKKIQVVKNINDNIPTFNGYPGKMNQVLMNLMTNAIDAVEKTDGNIQIDLDLDDQNSNIILKISDNGIGVPENKREQIFEPFYSTKTTGKGTGLGLSISKKIVIEHQGDITVSGKEGGGSVFTVRLPLNK